MAKIADVVDQTGKVISSVDFDGRSFTLPEHNKTLDFEQLMNIDKKGLLQWVNPNYKTQLVNKFAPPAPEEDFLDSILSASDPVVQPAPVQQPVQSPIQQPMPMNANPSSFPPLPIPSGPPLQTVPSEFLENTKKKSFVKPLIIGGVALVVISLLAVGGIFAFSLLSGDSPEKTFESLNEAVDSGSKEEVVILCDKEKMLDSIDEGFRSFMEMMLEEQYGISYNDLTEEEQSEWNNLVNTAIDENSQGMELLYDETIDYVLEEKEGRFFVPYGVTKDDIEIEELEEGGYLVTLKTSSLSGWDKENLDFDKIVYHIEEVEGELIITGVDNMDDMLMSAVKAGNVSGFGLNFNSEFSLEETETVVP